MSQEYSSNSQAYPTVPPTLVMDIHDQINAYREENRLPPLEWDTRIEPIAQTHSFRMAQAEIPTGPAGIKERTEELLGTIPGLTAMAENIVVGPPLPDMLVEVWVKSKRHRKNIRGNYKYTAIAASMDPQGQVYVTQIFVHY